MIEFQWDDRKAVRNERVHGVSFALAQAALESGLGVEIAEQFREGEWRTIVIAPFRGSLLLHITLAFYGSSEDEDIGTRDEEEANAGSVAGYQVIRIISARKATANEAALYFASRAEEVG